MLSELEFRMELAALAIAALVLPFYLGFVHATLVQLVIYTAAASLGLCLAEHLHFPALQKQPLTDVLLDLLLRGASILTVGGIAYLLALIV